ncbi:MAG: (cytosine-5-)-methyltransferase [Planctomycetota bacterium]|nr:(cytosine-5-)-methyltransferase [Planctomycetota bacterium]
MATGLRVLDLFSGIGGFALGLERAGMETVAFCERDGYACRVLRKEWPAVPIFEDVRTLTARRLKSHGITPNVICGGFPCQDVSNAGKGRGLDGERSGLWREYARLIREVRPRYAIVENVAALRSRGLDRVLGDLAALGYDAEWHCIPAADVGAPHLRDRIWIVAYPHGDRGRVELRLEAPRGGDLADRVELGAEVVSLRPRALWAPAGALQGAASPRICRVDDGLPHHVDRLRCLGNSVVPQVVELIGRAVAAHQAAGDAREKTAA